MYTYLFYFVYVIYYFHDIFLGGTELDDWPGGIKQKYLTLYPMIIETMKELKFSPEEMKKREYMGGEIGEDGK
jgi:hypothetical protein